MPLGSYNGYSGETRERSSHWLKGAYLMGLRPRPTQCAACGETAGIIVGHWETYEEPFHLNDEIPLCSICHLFVHSRRRHKTLWEYYVTMLEQGLKPSKPMLRFDWQGFESDWLRAGGEGWKTMIPGASVNSTVMRDIASGYALERAKEYVARHKV